MKINKIQLDTLCYNLKEGINVIKIPVEYTLLIAYITNILDLLIHTMRGKVASYKGRVLPLYNLNMVLEHNNAEYNVIYKQNSNNAFVKDIKRLGNVFKEAMAAKTLTQYPLIKSYMETTAVNKTYVSMYKLLERKMMSNDLVCTLDGGANLDYKEYIDEALQLLYSYSLEDQVQGGKKDFIFDFIDSTLYKIFPDKGKMVLSFKDNIFTLDSDRSNQGPYFDIVTASIQDLVTDIIIHAYCRTARKCTTQENLQAIDGIVLMSGYYMHMDHPLFNKAIHVLSDTFKNVQFIIEKPEN